MPDFCRQAGLAIVPEMAFRGAGITPPPPPKSRNQRKNKEKAAMPHLGRQYARA